QRAAALCPVEGRFGAAPIAPVFGDAGAIAGPAGGVGGRAQILDLQLQFAPRRAGDAEVEPLVEGGPVVAANPEAGGRAGDGNDFDIAAVEGRVDGDIRSAHRTSIVSPERPGNPANSALASFVAAACRSAKALLAVAVKRDGKSVV